MAETFHTVKQGECLYTISRSYGFVKWETVYHHENNAELREKRPDPNILYPGDKIYIPEKIKTPFRPTGPSHTIIIPKKSTSFKIRVLDVEGNPMIDAPFRLTVRDTVYEGHADEDGFIVQALERTAGEGLLEVFQNNGDAHPVYAWFVSMGGLDPVEEADGVQERLQNLAYYTGDITGEMDDDTQSALKRFQEDEGLEPTGEVCEKTRKRLTGEKE